MSKAKPDPIANAKATLVQLEDDRSAWDHELTEATSDLGDLSETRGRRLVDGDVTADDLATEEQRHRSRQANAEAAIAELDRRIAAARGRVIDAYAAHLREQVRPHQEALDEHRSKVDRLLAQLRDVDGVPYAVMPATQQAAQYVGHPVGDIPAGAVRASVTTRLTIPLEDLRGRVAKLADWTDRPLTADEYSRALGFAERFTTEAAATTRTDASVGAAA